MGGWIERLIHGDVSATQNWGFEKHALIHHIAFIKSHEVTYYKWMFEELTNSQLFVHSFNSTAM